MTSIEQIYSTRKEMLPLIESHAACWNDELVPALAKEDIHIRKFTDLPEKWKESLCEFFKANIAPAIKTSMQSFDTNKIENLNLALFVSGFADKDAFYILEAPIEASGRLIRVPTKGYKPNETGDLNAPFSYDYVFLEDLIVNNLDSIFPDEKNLVAYPFRVTRNGEIDIIMDESADFLNSVKKGVSNRKSGFLTRLECSKNMSAEIRETIAKNLHVADYLIYEFNGPLGLVDLWQLYKIDRPDLKDKTFLPSILPLLTPEKNLFTTISKRDIVLYHPYDGFEVIIDLLKEAASDSKVVEICITMYRMDHKSPIVDALIEAARNGKKVTAIIELKAKFDEENNILLVSKLQEAGINTVYNFPNLKVHAKLCLIVRKEKGGLCGTHIWVQETTTRLQPKFTGTSAT